MMMTNVIKALYRGVVNMYKLDYRSLALSRFFMGIVIIGDLLHRLSELHAHYTTDGLVYLRNYHGLIVFHSLNTSIYFQAFMFSLHIMVAFLFAIGYRTKIMSIALWFLTISLLEYNIIINSGGDALLRLVLFWYIFLPLGETFSVDSMRNSKKKKSGESKYIANVATLAFIVQYQVMYSISTTYKVGDAWTINYKATYISLMNLYFQTPLAKLVLLITPHFVLQILTYLVLKYEMWGPLLLTVPIWSDLFRFLGTFGFIILHIGFGSFLYLGIFMWVPIAGLCALIPGRLWDILAERMATERNTNDTIIISHDSRFSHILGKVISHFLVPSYTKVTSNEKLRVQSMVYELDHAKENEKKYLTIQLGGSDKYIHNMEALIHFFKHICLFTAPLKFLHRTILPNFVKNAIGALLYKIHEVTYHEKYDLKIIEYKKKLKKLPSKESKVLKIFNISMNLILQCIILYLIVTVIRYNLSTSNIVPTTFSHTTNAVIHYCSLHQSWRMFSPSPPKFIFVPILVGVLNNNQTVDLLSNGALIQRHWKPELYNDTFTIPYNLHSILCNHRWFKVFELGFRQTGPFLQTFGKYVCNEYNKRHTGLQAMKTVDLKFKHVEVNMEEGYDISNIEIQKLIYHCNVNK